MTSALDAFRAQREAVEDLRARSEEVAKMIQAAAAQANAIARDPELRRVLQEEQVWLVRAEETVRSVRAFRENELRHLWPAVWRRWVVALLFSLASAAAFGIGYGWTTRPYEAELQSLRARVELFDLIAQRVMTMTPAERRQFDALMRRSDSPKR